MPAARACQKPAKTLRRRGYIRRNQPRDVTEFKACDQQANSQEESNNVCPATSRLTRSKAIATAPAGIRTKTLKNRPRTTPTKAPPALRISISMPVICLILAYFSYVALMFSLTLMFFLGLMFFGTISPEPAAPPASLDSAELGLPPITGAALLRFASYAKANPATMPGVPQKPGRQSKKKPESATHRHIDASSHQGIIPGDS